ncbi:host specificity protein [Acinetobacter nosocomialis]|uniref:TipJ family phage tail tip protein n=1 Tax=Acinetobacter nosocomialis TaxID=106654 RepID=UPI0002E52ED1|nr:phage tail protein [Acinetobacter nosocomialis]AWL19439.1 host specificity protein [Acinetobacter nosocomialis]
MTAIVKGAKSGSQQPRQPVIAPDSAQSKTYIKELIGLAEGEVEGLANGNQSILLEETPLQDENGNKNFESVTVNFRPGTNDQEYIEGFPAVENEIPIDVELKSSTPWVRSFNNLDLDAVRLRLRWGPLRTQDPVNGDVTGYSIEYAVDLQTDGGAWAEVLRAKVSDKTSENYERAHRIDLPEADSGWLVRIRRITPNASSEYISDKMYVKAVTEVIDAKLRYPNTALISLQYDAETFGGSVAKLAVDLKGVKIKVPSNYNPETREYVGMWDGTFKRAYSNNPAWIYYDLCTSKRYGIGERITESMLDKWSLYRLAQYCDELVPDGQGGQEPHFTCNIYLQSAEDAYSTLTKLAGVFRAITYWDGESIVCDADIPQDTYFTYTRANIIGELDYNGTRARDRHNAVKVAWDNPTNHYKTEYEFVRDEKAISEMRQVRLLELDAWGCTSRGQAQRAGQWALKSEQLETRTVTFKVGLDGHIPLPGKVIEIADQLFAGRANGGRISAISADSKSITLDRDDVVAVAGDRLIINGEDGKAQTRIIQSIAGRVVTVTLAFDDIAPQNVWVIDAQDLATLKFRVLSVAQSDAHQFTITALEYNQKKFDAIDKGAHYIDVPISIVNPNIQEPVSNISITSEDRIDQGINIATMVVSWTQAKGAVKYLVEWRKDDGSWIKLPVTGNNSIEVSGIYEGNYQAKVTAINVSDISSLPAYSTLTKLVGKQGLPPALAFIQATGILFGMRLNWGFPSTGALDTAYTEIQVSPDGKSNIAQLGLFAYPTTTHTLQGLQPNLTQYYRGRLIDRIGNIGPWSGWTSATTSADASEILDMLEGKISETELSKDLQTKIDHIENIDAQIPGIIQDIKNTKDQIAQEVKDRQSSVQQAIDQANDNLNLEREARIKDIDSANQLIAQEVQNRINADFSEQKAREAAILEEAKSRETAITSEKDERISGDEHLSQRIETVSASSSDNAAAIQREEKARTDADSALGQRIDTVVAQAGDNAAAIQQEANARVEGDSANALLIETVRAESIENDVQTRALVTDESKARIDADRALAERVTGVEVVTKPALIGSESDLIGNDAGYAGVWSILSAVQEGDLLQAKRTDQVIVSVNDNAASINSEQIARIEGDKVVTKALTDYRANNDLALANVRQTAESAVSNSESNAKALTELDSRVNTVDANANEAKQNAASAISKAETAVSEAGSAASIAQQAHAEASTAATTANNAADNANEAKQTSATALSQANVAADQSAANAEQIQSIKVDLKDKASTGDIVQVKSEIKDVDNKITAQTTRIDGVYAQLNPPLIGSESELIGNDGGYAGVWSEQSARIEGDLVVSKRVDSTNAVLGDLQAYTQQEVQSRIEGDKITVQKIDNYIASNDNALAIVRDTAKIGVDQSSANIEAIKNINIELKDKATTGDIVQVRSDIIEVDKKITAQTIRLDGVYAQINPPLIGSDSDLIGNDGGYAGVWSEQSARIESDLAQAIRTDTVQTDLNGNKAAVQEVTKSVNGLYAQKFIKLDVNGKLAGWGGANDGIESQFIFNFDSIAIGNGNNGAVSYPFNFRTTSYVDPITGTIFPMGAYLKAAFMDYQSVDTSHIKDLAVQRGKIAQLAVGSGQIDDLAVTRGKIADLAVDTLKIADNAVTVPVSAFAETSVGVDTDYVTIQTLNVPSDMGHTVLTFGAVFSFTSYSQKQQVYCRVLKNDQVVFEDLEVHFIEHTSVVSITDANGSHNHNGSTVSVSGNTGQDGSHSHGFGVSGTTGSTNAGGTFHSHSFSSNGNTNNSGSHSHSVSLGGNITMSEGGEHKHNISVTGSSRSAGTLNISRHDSTGIFGTYKLQLRVVAGGSMNVSQRYIHAMTMRK